MGKQYATKEDLAYAAQVQKNTFVRKEEGKKLMADEEATKLSGIAAGAQVNVIEEVKVNGVAVPVTGKGIDITVPTDYQTEAQIKEAINAAIAGAYKVKGSTAFADLPTEGNKAGDMYNVTDAFTTTDAFKEGAGVEYPAGTNVAWTEDGKWDCMAGTYDLSVFVKAADIEEITQEEIDAMYTA